jgi:type I restriction enzyme S subunit
MKRWPTKKLGEIAAVQMGQSPPGETYNSDGVGLPFFQGKAEFGDEYPTTVKWCSQPLRVAEAGDVLLSVRAPVGPTNFAAERCCIGRGLAAIRTDPKVCNRRYVRYYMKRFEADIAARGVGSTFSAICRNDIVRLELPVPPLADQERIVKLLDEADELWKLRAQSDRRTAELIPALFHKMFGDPVKNPNGWPKSCLGELCELINGAPFKPTDWDGVGLPIIRIQNLNEPTKPFNYTSKHLPEKFRVRPGDILLSWSGTPGTSFGCFRWDGPEGWLNQHIFNVKLATDLDGEFFIHSVNARLNELIAKAHGGVGLQHVTKGVLNSVELLIPPLSLQRQFSERVNKIRELEADQTASRLRLEALFQSLLYEAFQGDL